MPGSNFCPKTQKSFLVQCYKKNIIIKNSDEFNLKNLKKLLSKPRFFENSIKSKILRTSMKSKILRKSTKSKIIKKIHKIQDLRKINEIHEIQDC